MERLTYNEVLAKQYYPNENIDNEEIFNKLGKLEDIEEELGIPLEVMFKALKDGIWYDNKHCPRDYVTLNYKDKSLKIYFAFIGIPIFVEPKLKDYGKTWALTREELENDI